MPRQLDRSLQSTLEPPVIHGDPEGDLLVVGWGSTLGAIEEAVDRLRADGHKVSSMHLRVLSPMPAGLSKVFERFARGPNAEGIPGAGLGLAIVHTIADEHRGQVSFSAPAEGGARVELTLPVWREGASA